MRPIEPAARTLCGPPDHTDPRTLSAADPVPPPHRPLPTVPAPNAASITNITTGRESAVLSLPILRLFPPAAVAAVHPLRVPLRFC